MGSTIGSILQGVGQTGNEAAAGDIAATRQSHEFMMDYLANQARSRGLDISQSQGQQQIDLEKQRLQQSRWQLMPGYSPIPDPDKPGNTLYRHTFVDPITKQQTYFDSDQPPPGSPEYQMNTFKFMRDNAKKNGIDLPINTLLSMSGMKTDNQSDINNKYQTYWQQLQTAANSDPAAKASLNKEYPGGYVDFFTKMIKGEHVGFSTADWNQYVMDNGLTKAGNKPNQPMDKMYEDTLVKSQQVYQKQLDDANKVIASMGVTGRLFNVEAYANIVSSRDQALQNLNDVRGKLDAFRSRSATPPEAGPTVNTQPAITNPPMAQDVALAHGATAQSKASDGNWYWHDQSGNRIGPAPGPVQ